MDSNIIPFPKQAVVRPAAQADVPSPWTVVFFVIAGVAAWEGFKFVMRPQRRRNPRRHRRAA